MANISTMLAPSSDRSPLTERSDLPIGGRTELKYCAPIPIADIALDVARGYLAYDALALGPRQRVTSLYLDSPHLTFLRWHRLGATDRFKLRIRRYGDQPTPTLYAEVKRKTGSVVRKRRAAFPVNSLHLVLGSSYVPSSEAMPGDSDDLKAFVRHRARCRATPRVLVTCVRESLRDAMDGTALTVDRDLRYQPNRRADLAGITCAWRPIPLPGHSGTEMALVELKYSTTPPPWMDALIGRLAPWRVSFSKYAAAMSESVPAEIC